MLARLQGGDGYLDIAVPAGRDMHQIDGGIGKDIAIVRIERGAAVFWAPLSAGRAASPSSIAANLRPGTPTIILRWISPNQPTPITPTFKVAMTPILYRQYFIFLRLTGTNAGDLPSFLDNFPFVRRNAE